MIKKIKNFMVIGVSTQTTNQDGKSAEDLSKLWERFYAENVIGRVPNKMSGEIYVIYTDYETDFNGNYTAIVGLRVSSLIKVPEGFVGRKIAAGEYHKMIVRGKIPDEVAKTWKEIWEKDQTLNRAYTTDFELYGAKSQKEGNAEVEIYIATK